MKHKLFFLYCLALMSFLFVVTGTLDLVGHPNVEIGFWDGSTIESDAGKVAWIAVSAACLLTFLTMAAREHRR